MTRRETIERVCRKVVANGYKRQNVVEAVNGAFKSEDWQWLLDSGYYKIVIYDPEFAKALWGDYPLRSVNIATAVDVTPGSTEQPERLGYAYANWQHHLSEMVIAEDDVTYLGENGI